MLKIIYDTRRIILLVSFLLSNFFVLAQGFNHAWLLGYDNPTNMARLNFTNSSMLFSLDPRSMEFSSTQGNISDADGNFIMSSNGIWIANRNNTMMLNGGGLNPNSFTSSWTTGLPLTNGNIVLPWPNDTTKYVLFHQTGSYNAPNLSSEALFYSVIDKTGDFGNGVVVSKNNIITQTLLGWGLGACKHANGRDWWIIALSDSGNVAHKILLKPDTIVYIGQQNLMVPPYPGWAGQPTFSNDGSKFAFGHGKNPNGTGWIHNIRYFNFDRCSGNLFNNHLIDISDGNTGYGVAFSPNSKYLYVSKFDKVLQLNTDTTDIASSLDTVAVYDGFYSPYPPFATDFWLMYLAANGKIYITSGNSVQHIHYIDNPDLDGLSCDVVQHGLDLNGIWHLRSVPVHPNYYLGAVSGSICDSLSVGINEVEHDFKFSVSPNPTNGDVKVIYLLPQNKSGLLEIFDISGRSIFSYSLPQWSTLQQFDLSYLSQGVYAVKISSDGYIATKKIIITE